MPQFLMIIILLLLTGSGGIKSGYLSMPYTSTQKTGEISADNYHQLYKLKSLNLPDLEVTISLNNELQTSDIIWLGIFVPIIPIPVDLDNRYIHQLQNDNEYCIDILLKPSIDNFALRPHLITLSINKVSYNVVLTKEIVYYKGTKNETMKNEKILTNTEILMQNEVSNKFNVCFNSPRPTHNDIIELDLISALMHPEGIKLPLIKFSKIKYSYPYN